MVPLDLSLEVLLVVSSSFLDFHSTESIFILFWYDSVCLRFIWGKLDTYNPVRLLGFWVTRKLYTEVYDLIKGSVKVDTCVRKWGSIGHRESPYVGQYQCNPKITKKAITYNNKYLILAGSSSFYLFCLHCNNFFAISNEKTLTSFH